MVAGASRSPAGWLTVVVGGVRVFWKARGSREIVKMQRYMRTRSSLLARPGELERISPACALEHREPNPPSDYEFLSLCGVFSPPGK